MSLGRDSLAWASLVPLGRGLGEEHEFASVILSPGRQNVAWARAPRLGEKGPAWARTPRLGESSCAWARMAQSLRPEGAHGVHRVINDDPSPGCFHRRFFYFASKEDSYSRRWCQFPPVQNDGARPSQGRRTWPNVVDAPSSSRAVKSSGRGVGSCKKSLVLRISTPPNYASGIWHHAMEEEDEEEDEVIELVKVESSVEVVDLVPDSEEEEDPSEGSSIPGIF
ncbi:unnamed protein product [Lupinus luteus]|uniref:Uncharacterized protein n=1 Tax=Lupinus luteus TaxID=3873 RepID=A0AAV1WTN0_LUPLU